MPVLIPTEQVEFCSHGIRCAAWLTLPASGHSHSDSCTRNRGGSGCGCTNRGEGPHPAVVLVHGLGATHDMMLAQYEQHFAAAGIAELAFDYR